MLLLLLLLLLFPVPDLQITLVGVEDDGLVFVVEPLHLQRQSADGRLEVGLLCIHHQANAILNGMLGKKEDVFSIK